MRTAGHIRYSENFTLQFSRKRSAYLEEVRKRDVVELIGKLPLKYFVCTLEIAGCAIRLF